MKVRGGGGVRFVRIDSPKPIFEKEPPPPCRNRTIRKPGGEDRIGGSRGACESERADSAAIGGADHAGSIAVDEVVDSIGRQTIETILELSAEQVAGPRTPGKTSGDVRWHGTAKGPEDVFVIRFKDDAESSVRGDNAEKAFAELNKLHKKQRLDFQVQIKSPRNTGAISSEL